MLTKSDYKIARTCITKLYYKKLRYPTTLDVDEFMELLRDGGFMIDAIAKLLFYDGITVNESNRQGALDATLKLITQDNVILFESAFLSAGKFARPDILMKDGNHLTLIEVKAKSYDSSEENPFRGRKNSIKKDWQPYLEDITYQAVILRELFPVYSLTCELMMPDKSLTTTIDNLHSLFEVKQITLEESGYSSITVTYTGNVDQLRHDHFLTRVNVDAEVNELTSRVKSETETFLNSLNPLVKIPTKISFGCRDCEYRLVENEKQNGFRECWGDLADVKPPIFEMYNASRIPGRNGPLVNELINLGKVSIVDLPETALLKKDGTVGALNKRQLVQLRNTQANTEWIDPALHEVLNSFTYPLHFIDFETSGLAVPYHAGMHPYENVAFQWSCHTLRSPNTNLEHTEWINIEKAFPNFAFAESLMDQIGDQGTFLMWGTHENTIFKVIRNQMEGRYKDANVKEWLEWMTDNGNGKSRLIDMNDITLKHYFHPIMGGRTSVKKVVDAIWKINPTLREQFPAYLKEQDGEIFSPYKSLPPLIIDGKEVIVAEGTGAIRAYQAMLYGPQKLDLIIRELWKKILLQYCELDTLSMVMVFLHWKQLLVG